MSMIALSTLLLLARLRLVLAPLGGGVFTGHHRLKGGVTGSTIGAGLGGAAGGAVGNNWGMTAAIIDLPLSNMGTGKISTMDRFCI